MKKVNVGLLVGIALVMMIGITLLSFTDLLVGASQYGTFADARKEDKSIHVVGEWVQRDQANYDPNQDLFTFYMKDTVGTVEQVHYMDPMPANFDAADRVVIEGKYKENVFLADRIIMKCPSKFNEDNLDKGMAIDRP